MENKNDLQKYYIDYYFINMVNRIISGQIDINSSDIANKIEQEIRNKSLNHPENLAANPFLCHSNKSNDSLLNYDRVVSIIITEYLKKLKKDNKLNLASNDHFVSFLTTDNKINKMIITSEEFNESIRNVEDDKGLENIKNQIQILIDVCNGKSLIKCELLMKGIKETFEKYGNNPENFSKFINNLLSKGLNSITRQNNCRQDIIGVGIRQEEIESLIRIYLTRNCMPTYQLDNVNKLSEELFSVIFEQVREYKPKTK